MGISNRYLTVGLEDRKKHILIIGDDGICGRDGKIGDLLKMM
jgi:hypothetical protein